MPATTSASEQLEQQQRRQLLDAAETLFYGNGIQAVGMDQIRAHSGLPLKQIYRLYPSKEQLVVGMLQRRDTAWRGRMAAAVERVRDPRERVLAVFDWLYQWFAEPGFRGCAWINAYGELGSQSPAVAEAVRAHKQAFHRYVARLMTEAGQTGPAAEAVCLLAEGAMVTAAIERRPDPAIRARTAVASLLTRP